MARNESRLWCPALAVGAVLLAGIFIIGCSSSGDGDSQTCDRRLPEIGSTSVSGEAFFDQDAALKDVVNTLNTGDRAEAEAVYYGPVGAFTRVVHSILTEHDPAAADDLCQWLTRVGDGFSGTASNSSVAVRIDHVRGLLRDAAASLGYERPGP